MDKRAITIQDLYRIKVPSDPQISPGGERVVFTVKSIDQDKNRYLSHLYVAEIANGAARQFTQGEVKDQQPRWSPDGTRIAFLRTKEEDTQIWLILADGGEAQQLTHVDEGKFGNVAWSPDGTRLTFEYRLTHPDWTRDCMQTREEKGLSNPPRLITRFHYRLDGDGFLDLRQKIWLCDVKSGEVYPLTEGEWDDRDPTWSPDANSIAFISNRSDDPETKPFEEDIWVVNMGGGRPEKISSPRGYKWGLSWSPSGSHLAYIGSETTDDPWLVHNDRVWVLSSQGGNARCLTAGVDRIAENASLSDVRGTGNQAPLWSEDGSCVFFLISDRGSCHLYTVTLEGEIELVADGKLDVTGFSLDDGGTSLALLASFPDQPSEIFTMNLDEDFESRKLIPISQANASFLAETDLSLPEEIWLKSTDDTDIQGWLLKPPEFNPHGSYPLLLYIHGGPPAQYANTFFHEFQVLAAHGYVVLYTNPRGSLGREEEFATCIRGDWGNLDYKDLMAAVDYAEILPYIDSQRMGVVGGSYGGFMTVWTLGHTDRFRCAIAERGVYNRHSAVGTSDFPPMPDGYWPGNTWDQTDRLWEQSPLRLAGNIRTPLMIIHSEGDLRCPIGQAEQLYAALKRLKRDVIFLRYPTETSHGFSRSGPPDLRIDRLERIINWLDKHLK